MLQVVGDLPPPGQLQSLHGRVLDVHVGVHSVPDQELYDGILGCVEEVVRVELESKPIIFQPVPCINQGTTCITEVSDWLELR